MPPNPGLPPILAHKHYSALSVFTLQNLRREARRQKSLSAGQITPIAQPPYFFVIEKALRDEGASYHYLPPAL